MAVPRPIPLDKHTTVAIGAHHGHHTRRALCPARPLRLNVLAIPHVRLSELLPEADLVVQHGGIGTTYASLRAAVPSLVVPRAFDQVFNCRLLEKIGVGVESAADAGSLAIAIENTIERSDLTLRAHAVAEQLITSRDATDAIASYLTRAL